MFVTRSQARQLSAEFPVGDAFDGPAYGRKTDWGTAITAGASLLGGSMAADSASSAADSAASTQAGATASSIAEQRRQFDQTRADQAPWLNTGKAALSKLSDYLGLDVPEQGGGIDWQKYLELNPDVAADPFYGTHPQNHYEDHGKYETWRQVPYLNAGTTTAHSDQFGTLLKPFSMADYQEDPGYQFRLDQGQKAIDAALRARGLYNSGGALKAITDYNSGAASQEYQNAYNRYNQDQTTIFNRLSGVAGTGQNSANTLANTGANTSNNISNLLTGQGDATAAAQIAAGNARSSAYTSGFKTLGDALSKIKWS